MFLLALLLLPVHSYCMHQNHLQQRKAVVPFTIAAKSSRCTYASGLPLAAKSNQPWPVAASAPLPATSQPPNPAVQQLVAARTPGPFPTLRALKSRHARDLPPSLAYLIHGNTSVPGAQHHARTSTSPRAQVRCSMLASPPPKGKPEAGSEGKKISTS